MSGAPSVGIVDYGVGNLRSVANAVEHLGARPVVSGDPDVLDACDRLILPGVGAFAHGMEALSAAGLDRFVRGYVAEDRPSLGICLGMQMLHEASTEFGTTTGLGFMAGTVDRLTAFAKHPDEPRRMPNVGWLPLRLAPTDSELADRVLGGLSDDDTFYFIHSYGLAADTPSAAATSEFDGLGFASVVARRNLIGMQFHPEKSRDAGLGLLRRFIF